MVWEERQIELRMKAALPLQFGSTEGENLWSHYVSAREKLCSDVYKQIPVRLPEYTDHSQRHIENVLDNVDKLVGGEVPTEGHDYLNAADAYCLCLSTLFHDVGMVWGRQEHEKNVAAVYKWVRGGTPLRQERHIVVRAAGAHSGTTETGSRDTIGDLPEIDHFKGECIHLREIAAVLRFADELAEGPQRTSVFMKEMFGFSSSAAIHHRYAECTEIHIDRAHGRIAITYNIDINTKDCEPQHLVNELEQLLLYVFKRIIKLDQERQYAAYYSKAIKCFDTTTVQFNYWIDEDRAPIDLNKLVLPGKCIPGESAIDLHVQDPEYDVQRICQQVLALVRGRVQ